MAVRARVKVKIWRRCLWKSGQAKVLGVLVGTMSGQTFVGRGRQRIDALRAAAARPGSAAAPAAAAAAEAGAGSIQAVPAVVVGSASSGSGGGVVDEVVVDVAELLHTLMTEHDTAVVEAGAEGAC